MGVSRFNDFKATFPELTLAAYVSWRFDAHFDLLGSGILAVLLPMCQGPFVEYPGGKVVLASQPIGSMQPCYPLELFEAFHKT